MNRRYFFDADGVLMHYERDAYVGENPRWLRKNEHYFRNLEPDRKMLKVFDELNRIFRYTQDELFILSSLSNNGMIFNEHLHDKLVSFNTWYPYMDIDHIIISVGPKRDVVEYITNNPVSSKDILIDDWNKNLEEWKKSNGTSVKYCNGINNPESFAGHKILADMTSDEIVQYLLSF